MFEDFDVFLCFNPEDKARVKAVAEQLQERGIRPWFDEQELRPGRLWQKPEKRILQIRSAAVFVGIEGSGPWQHLEIDRLLREFVLRGRPVIPVLLPESIQPSETPSFLEGGTWVDFRKSDPDPLGQLIWGITGARPLTDRPIPRYPDSETRDLSQALQEAYHRRDELAAKSLDISSASKKILDLRRAIRQGGELKAGDLLLDGRFKLLERIGSGGFGNVWKAYDKRNRAVVAVKVLHGQYVQDKSRRERFFRGARKMAELQHQGIVRVVEQGGEDGAYHFFVMEYLGGGDLRQAVLSTRLSSQEGLRVILEIGEALQFAHDHSVVHRDVKPSNVLLDVDGRPKLTDFDLVRAQDTTGGTRTGMLGTFMYAAPEVMERAKSAEASADVYGLGMTAAFALHGADLPLDVLRDPQGFLGRLSVAEGVKATLGKAIAWDVEQRWKSVAEFCRELRQGLDEPALRERVILVAKHAAETAKLSELDELLASLPDSEETTELRRYAHEITVAAARLDTLDRPFMRDPFAALLVKEIEAFEHQIAASKSRLAIEFRKAARAWLKTARQQLKAARVAAAQQPTHQVFRAGDPVNREREAFVPRDGILGELEQQIALGTGCPGLVVYGRRRMGKSSLLHNLEGLLPPHVKVVYLSMQQASAFTSLSSLVDLLGQRVANALPESSPSLENLKDLERFLEETQDRLAAVDYRLVLAIDEYENLDRKIREGVLSEDLLAVIRESIQMHRNIIWTFAGSHSIDELIHAPWSSYLMSARTIEVRPFGPEETRLLLTEPLKYSTLWRDAESKRPRFEPGFWGEGGIDHIHSEAGGWPHLVQLLAETAVDLVNNSGASRVDAAILNNVMSRAVVRGNNVFIELLEKESHLPGEWDYLRAFRSIEDQPMPEDDSIAHSLRHRLLVEEENGCLRLRVPLMARWLRERI